MLDRLKELRATREQFPTESELLRRCRNDLDFKKEIKALTRYFLRRDIPSCNNCIAEAYFELLIFKIEKFMKCDFELKAGAVLHDPRGDAAKLVSNANLTNELAIYHLQTHPNCRVKFIRLPKNVEELLKMEIERHLEFPETATFEGDTERTETVTSATNKKRHKRKK
ncbi:MAG: hypothetical protein LBS50_11265 [Prevotellaceae bacterium]|jgi:hypothetical protein|nr:hypothetical protein [Prevotellaceae bacterium]